MLVWSFHNLWQIGDKYFSMILYLINDHGMTFSYYLNALQMEQTLSVFSDTHIPKWTIRKKKKVECLISKNVTGLSSNYKPV